MPKANRGDTSKLTLYLSNEAKQQIKTIGLHLNMNQSNLVMFALTHYIENGLHNIDFEDMLSSISFPSKRESCTISVNFKQKVDELTTGSTMSKAKFLGYLVSFYFQTFPYKDLLLIPPSEEVVVLKYKLDREIHESLETFSNTYNIPQQGIISFALWNRPKNFEEIHSDVGSDEFFVKINRSLKERIEEEAEQLGVTIYQYTYNCLLRFSKLKEKKGTRKIYDFSVPI